jgi:hypothetical protein
LPLAPDSQNLVEAQKRERARFASPLALLMDLLQRLLLQGCGNLSPVFLTHEENNKAGGPNEGRIDEHVPVENVEDVGDV